MQFPFIHVFLLQDCSLIYSCTIFCINAVSIFQEGLTIMESRTADIIQETRKHIKKKPGGSEVQSQAPNHSSTWQQPQMQTDQELQLKASRDVRWQLCITGSYNRKTCVHGLL